MMEKSYGEAYYNNYDIGSERVKYLECVELRRFHANIAGELTAHFHPKTILDAGCAMGVLVSEFIKQGVDAYGIDFSEYAVTHADPAAKEKCFCGSLAKPFPEGLPVHFDLVTCMEVLEHMSPEDGRKAIENICRVTDTVLFCSTPDDFEDETHINVQQREYWAGIFAENGFYDDLSYRPLFMTEYAACYRRAESAEQAIRGYEYYVRKTDAMLRDSRDEHYRALEKEHNRAVAEWEKTADLLHQANRSNAELQTVCNDRADQLAEMAAEHETSQRMQSEQLTKMAAEHEASRCMQAEQLQKTTAAWNDVAQQLEKTQCENAELRESCRKNEQELQTLTQDHESMMTELQQLDQLTWDLKRGNADLAAVNQAYTELKAEYDKAMGVYHDTYVSLNNVSAILAEMKSSRSWKMTAPIRWTTLHLKHFIGRSARKLYRGAKRAREYLQKTRNKKNISVWPPRVAPVSAAEAVRGQKDCRRLAIYSIYDKDGFVDEYILFYLKELKKFVQCLVVVSNGPLQEAGKAQLEQLGCRVLERENKGFDAWGIKYGIDSVGFEELSRYDELLISNDTLFGPVYDMKDMFSTMKKRKLDFWGISSHSGWKDMDPFGCNPYGYIPEHIQSFFYVVRNRMLQGEAFKKFWTELPELPDYNAAIGLYETTMTQYFRDAGYVGDTYMDPADYYDMTEYPLLTIPVESIRDLKCPFFKRRAFIQDYDYLTNCTGQQSASCLLQYLKECTDYPTDMIFKNLIRTCHMSELVLNLHLSTFLEKDSYFAPETPSKLKAALFMHIYDETMAPELAAYAASMPKTADIFISTVSEQKKQAILQAFSALPNKVEVRVLPNRGRDVSALLTSFRDVVMNYDVACVTHDKKTGYLKPQTVGEGFAYMGYENILGSASFVEQVLLEFQENPFLGMFYAPDPNHADFATHIGLEWGQNFECTRDLAQKLHLHVPMDEVHPPMAPFGSSFWFRTAAMKPLFEKQWTYEDFPQEPFQAKDGSILHAIERIYPYVAQEAGYYSAMLMTTDYAAIDIGNLSYYAQGYVHACFESGIANSFVFLKDHCRRRLSHEGGMGPEQSEKSERLYRLLTRWADCE